MDEVLTSAHLNARVEIDHTPTPLEGLLDTTGGGDTGDTPSYATGGGDKDDTPSYAIQLTQYVSYSYAYLEGEEGRCELGFAFSTPGFIVLKAQLEPLPQWLLTPCNEPSHEDPIRSDNFEPSFAHMKIHVALPPPPIRHQVTWSNLSPMVYGTVFAEHHFDARLVPPVAGTLSYFIPDYRHEDDVDPSYVLAHEATVNDTGKTIARYHTTSYHPNYEHLPEHHYTHSYIPTTHPLTILYISS